MSVSLVLTVLGADRPGLVESLAEVAANHDANWTESRMARLAGKFAGILRVDAPEDKVDSLVGALTALESEGLKVVAERSSVIESGEARTLHLELVGADRPGIIRHISHALAKVGVNVEDLSTELTSAPMSGEPLFTARILVTVPPEADLGALRDGLEQIANELMVDLNLQSP